MRRTCPVCKKSFYVTCNLNARRANLTDTPECRRIQRVARRRELRHKLRLAKLKERHRAQVRRAHKPKKKGRKCRN
jgi:hypothetical protein